ncbi:MAG: hypothetical protein LKF31_10760 [Muribaculaceae bacterium]|jgi:hypothetical protein|nr:hypothetical protein [Muribaculaceae bacterium]
MKSAKFILISLLCIFGCFRALPCTPESQSGKGFLFSVYNHNSIADDSVRIKNIAFWHNYVKGKVSDNSIENAIYDLETYSADNKVTHDTSLIQFLKKEKDTDAVHYLELLKQTSAISNSYNSWDYPSKAQQAIYRKVWASILIDASKRITSSKRLSSRYWLMAVRAAFYSKNASRCKQIYAKYAKRFRNSYIKDLAEGYLAYYWLHNGQREKAREFYAHVGDLRSLRWCFKDNINMKGIKALYAECPSSVAFPYLIQDFVNSRDFSCNQYADDDSMHNNQIIEFCKFANKVLKEGKVKNPALWQSAAAFLTFINGHADDALNGINKAAMMKGTPRVMDNIRVLRFAIMSSAFTRQSGFNDYAVNEFTWLAEKIKSEPTYVDYSNKYSCRNHYSDAYERIVKAYLVPQLMKNGDFATAAAVMSMDNEFINGTFNNMEHQKKVSEDYQEGIIDDYSNGSFEMLDTASIDDVRAYAKLLMNPDKAHSLARYAAYKAYNNPDFLNELIGTKYLRIEYFSKAIHYLSKVSLSYINSMNITPYLHRNIEIVHGFEFLYLNKNERDKSVLYTTLSSNPKLEFAKTILATFKAAITEKDTTKKANLFYKLGEYYIQASLSGSCWAYLHYSWSSQSLDVPSYGQDSYLDNAKKMFENSMLIDKSDYNSIRCLMALASIENIPWDETFDDGNCYKFARFQFLEIARYFICLNNYRNSPAFSDLRVGKCDNIRFYMESIGQQ